MQTELKHTGTDRKTRKKPTQGQTWTRQTEKDSGTNIEDDKDRQKTDKCETDKQRKDEDSRHKGCKRKRIDKQLIV